MNFKKWFLSEANVPPGVVLDKRQVPWYDTLPGFYEILQQMYDIGGAEAFKDDGQTADDIASLIENWRTSPRFQEKLKQFADNLKRRLAPKTPKPSDIARPAQGTYYRITSAPNLHKKGMPLPVDVADTLSFRRGWADHVEFFRGYYGIHVGDRNVRTWAGTLLRDEYIKKNAYLYRIDTPEGFLEMDDINVADATGLGSSWIIFTKQYKVIPAEYIELVQPLKNIKPAPDVMGG